jgi:hypothetical protein
MDGFVFNKCYDSFCGGVKVFFKISNLSPVRMLWSVVFTSVVFELFIFWTLKYTCVPTGMHTNSLTEIGVQCFLHRFCPRSQLIEEDRQHWILNSRANLGLDLSYGLNCYVIYLSETAQCTSIVVVYCSCSFQWIVVNNVDQFDRWCRV